VHRFLLRRVEVDPLAVDQRLGRDIQPFGLGGEDDLDIGAVAGEQVLEVALVDKRCLDIDGPRLFLDVEDIGAMRRTFPTNCRPLKASRVMRAVIPTRTAAASTSSIGAVT
jgi:hypothetical protein